MSNTHPRRNKHETPVHRITEARESHAVDQHSRMRKYVISMSVRIICFVLAFFTSGPVQWIMLALAIVLPYIAVVLANRGADLTKREPPAEFYTAPNPAQVEAGSVPDEDTAQPKGFDLIDGTLTGEEGPEATGQDEAAS